MKIIKYTLNVAITYYLFFSWLYLNHEFSENCMKFLIWSSFIVHLLGIITDHKSERKVNKSLAAFIHSIPIIALAGHGEFLYAALYLLSTAMSEVCKKDKEKQP